MNLIKQFPNFITLCNLFCGCLGIAEAMAGRSNFAAYFILAGLLLDFADGWLARLLKAQSETGKQLDSLADLVTFGLLPSLILYNYYREFGGTYLKYIVFLLPVFSAIRLARFNLDPAQKEYFRGLPTPACALLIASFPLIVPQLSWFGLLINPYVLTLILLILLILLVAPLPMLSLKFKDATLRNNPGRYLFLSSTLISLLIWQYVAVPVIFLLYIFISLVYRR